MVEGALERHEADAGVVHRMVMSEARYADSAACRR
jgi:hypothetical protein